ncbi:MAG TPA: MarR family transcriptional regulator [Castellaniella sp.]|uniref:MarR family winged helix-turn-helix transcriptional regulator n=1 Tax=Castellaniella sp. TaxID=1955812 RepID=UPI002F0967F4
MADKGKSPGKSPALEYAPDIDPEDRLAHLIRYAARSLVRGLQMRLAEHNVLFGHWAFLRILWEEDGLTQHELNERAGLMEPTTYSALRAMESLGYIERKHLPGNRKNLYVFLTPAGRELQDKLVPLAQEVNSVSTRGLSDEDIGACRRVLLGIASNMDHDETRAEDAGRRLPSTRELSSWIKQAELLRANE